MVQELVVSVAVSIVLALSMARLLSAVPHLLAPDRRYWVPCLWAASLLPIHLGFWWAMWAYREVDAWTFRGFAAVMLTPVLLFLRVTIPVSDSPRGCPRCYRVFLRGRGRNWGGFLRLVSPFSLPLEPSRG